MKGLVFCNPEADISLHSSPYIIHAYAGSDISIGVDENEVFGDNSSCILQPEATVGPYYVNGELIKKNVREDQAGVSLLLGQLFFDQSCEPYEFNTQSLTVNSEDNIFSQESDGADLFVEYTLIDPNSSTFVTSATTIYESSGEVAGIRRGMVQMVP